ncbi:Short-chain dehydrogenase/reductase SDR [Corchorus olitorius]|uniref:Short-chain dehydrogenase/reductase SDR n=1 Tax=Corchorus olitorius TaxID=93759 RepID=A0A1R3KPV2_9ROSI|nr:Short-chain dehydrogenase/reductase SDR [Corchorus olitorius]
MASSAQKSQKQQSRPGKEHVMDPRPKFFNPEYKPSNKLQGKVALVTGGDSGIGRAVCYYFALEGASVAFTYVKNHEEKDRDETLQMLNEAKSREAKKPIAISADLGYEEECKKVIDATVQEFGKLDILVNDAAEKHFTTSVEEITENQLERVFRTNIFSQFFMCKHALKHMKEGSAIINTTSVMAYTGSPTMLDYTATKGAIVAFTRGLALQLAERGIRVNGVAAGPTWTPLVHSSFPQELLKNFGNDTPMGRPAQTCELAPCYVFLASPQCSSYFSGQFLHPNGQSSSLLISSDPCV